jgi:hypothetical protein
VIFSPGFALRATPGAPVFVFLAPLRASSLT